MWPQSAGDSVFGAFDESSESHLIESDESLGHGLSSNRIQGNNMDPLHVNASCTCLFNLNYK